MNLNTSKKEENPILTANFISKWCFWWVLKLLYKGRNRPLQENEIYAQPPKLDSERLTRKFTCLWNDELKCKNQSILRLIIRAYGFAAFRFAFLYSAIETATKVMQTLSLGALLTALADKSEDSNKMMYIYLYAVGVVIFSVFAPLLYHPYTLYIFSISGRIRLGLSGLIYKKILVTSCNASNDELNGRAINLISNDLAKFDRALNLFQDLFKGPCQVFILGYLMYREIGWSAILGIAFILLLIPLQGWGANKVAVYRKRAAERSDNRVKLMNEIIQGIQTIKMYAWENIFAQKVKDIRQTELKAISGTMKILAMLATTSIIPKISIFVSLIAYVYLGDEITARKIFIVSSLFNTLSFTMVGLWPSAATSWAEAYISCKRVKEFLIHNFNKTDEKLSKSHYNNYGFIASEDLSRKSPPILENYIKFENVNASWNSQRKTLKNINFHIADKSTVAIVGAVGAGKSSLLNVILGELQINQGLVKMNGKLSYAPQQPWIFEGTIKENIIFISDYNEERYKKVIEVCALRKDFDLMNNGDLTVVGERGTSLSGGQKARINMARAIYKTADIYLLDDPLSAVDTHVGSHIFKKCITEYLKDKICILVTHQLQYLEHIQNVIAIKSGEIDAMGSFKHLQELKLFEFMKNNKNSLNKSSDDRIEPVQESHFILPVKAEHVQTITDGNREESQAIGSVQFRIYKLYFQSVNSWLFVMIVTLLFICGRTLTGGVDYFISRWVNWEEKISQNQTANSKFIINIYEPINSTQSANMHSSERVNIILTYTILLIGALILFIIQNFGFFQMCLRISKSLHGKLYNGVSQAGMLFFNYNSSGRILNRFSKDINTIDSIIPQILLDCITFICNLTAVLIIVSIANYTLLVPAIVVGVLFYLLRRFYINPSRSIKRIEALSRSPVYSHINQTFQGLPTIRALNAEQEMENNFHIHQNANTSPWYMFISTSYAFGFWLDFVIFIYIASVTFILIFFSSHASSGDVGLAILQCISLVGGCQWGIKQSAELENQMVSAERIQEYVEQPAESSPVTQFNTPVAENWPSKGEIIFKNFSMKYSKISKQVLKNLNFEINANQKIGIVGRTGAGKSSIIQAIFRLANNEGVIEIDGIDINEIELYDLRKKISIIPQDPVLFSGTMRYNLDPFEKFPDEYLWKVLEEIQLKSVIPGLDCIVNDGGSNFSVGQRQLICLARAILRDNKILILDEATANVDLETDYFVQHIIKTKFKNCTVLTIAHRLNTVMDSDKIMVMDDGNLVEMGKPKDLLRIINGHFNSLFHGSNKD